jgi:hypothetical protein
MAVNNNTAGRTSDTVDSLGNVSLWVRLDTHRSTWASECEVATALLNTANTTTELIEPKDILGVQYMASKQPYWIINLVSKRVKGLVLAADSVDIKGKSFKLSDFSRTKTQRSNTRLSIHGIPQHVSDADIESWVSSFAKRNSPIFRHKSKDKGPNNQFHHLHTGHRFCYVSEITESKPRFSKMNISNPLDPTSLDEIEVTLYYNGQSDNFCKYCHSSDHQIAECPLKPKQKCYLCGDTGHVKYNCPHKDKGPKCFSCNMFGHRSFDCLINSDDDLHLGSADVCSSNQSPTKSSSDEDFSENQRATEASALAQELIDHCLHPNSQKSPELLEKVKSVLNIASENAKRVQEESSMNENSRKKTGGKKNKKSKKTVIPIKSQVSSSAGKKKQVTLSFETSTKVSSKRKEITPDKNEHRGKREKKDSVENTSSNERSRDNSYASSVGRNTMCNYIGLSPKK